MTEDHPTEGNATEILDDPDNHRFVVRMGDDEAELVYRRNGRRLVLIHTGVPEALSGQGIAGRLVAAAVARAREEGLVLVPSCPYARRWLEQHPDDAAGIPIDWPNEPDDSAAPQKRGARSG